MVLPSLCFVAVYQLRRVSCTANPDPQSQLGMASWGLHGLLPCLNNIREYREEVGREREKQRERESERPGNCCGKLVLRRWNLFLHPKRNVTASNPTPPTKITVRTAPPRRSRAASQPRNVAASRHPRLEGRIVVGASGSVCETLPRALLAACWKTKIRQESALSVLPHTRRLP